MHTACAPMASAVTMSLPRRKPLSTRIGMRSPTASTISGNTAMVALTPSSTAVVGDDDGIDPGIGGELCVFEGDNALEYELDLDRIAQALDHIPGQVGNDGAADAAEIDAVATVDRICRWLPAFAALATATSASG